VQARTTRKGAALKGYRPRNKEDEAMNLIELTSEAFEAVKNFKFGHGRYAVVVTGEYPFGEFSIEIRIKDNEISQVWASKRVAPDHGSSFKVTPAPHMTISDQMLQVDVFFNQIVNEGNYDHVEVYAKPSDMEEIYRKKFWMSEILKFKSIPELVELGKEGREAFAQYLKSVDKIVGEGNEYHPDWMDSIFDACDELGWDADKFVAWMWGSG